MKFKKDTVALILFALVFFALGYFRNYIFLTLNNRASALYYHAASPPLNGIFYFFRNCDYNSLITAKWALTFTFILIFAVVSSLTLYLVFNENTYIYLCLTLYGLIFILCSLFMLLAKLIPPFANHSFNISRNLAHLAQSPIITIILFLAIYYSRQPNKKDN